jgi:hypothetical protein
MPVSIPEEHLKVITEAELALDQFKAFMNGESSSLIIRSEAEYANASSVIKTVKDLKKRVVESKEIVVGPIYKDYKDSLAIFTDKITLLNTKITALDIAGRSFRKKVEAEARARQLEENRKAEEAKRKAEEAARKANLKAKEAAEKGRDDLKEKWESRAEQAETVAQSTVADIVTPNIPKNTRGAFNTRKTYVARITNIGKVLNHFSVCCPPDIRNAIQKWCNAQARAAKGAVSSIPGVTFHEN